MLFLALLDQDSFGGRLRGGEVPDASHLMRRCLKESLLTFDGKPLFPERRAYSVKYDLSPSEQHLYDEVTDYVRHGMDRAKQIEQKNRRRGLVVGFALAALQRRLASSPQANLPLAAPAPRTTPETVGGAGGHSRGPGGGRSTAQRAVGG